MQSNFVIKLHPEEILGVDLPNIVHNKLVVEEIGLEIRVLDAAADRNLQQQ